LKSGEKVIDRVNSHIHSNTWNILPVALAKIEAKGKEFIIEEIDFGRVIGRSICVKTNPEDRIWYAQRVNRWGLSRFVRNREPEPCSTIVVILKKAEESGEYILITAFIGHLSEPEPWDQRSFSRQANPAQAEEKSRRFWANHALVWGMEEANPETITMDCPW
jgi:hypothetical protein